LIEEATVDAYGESEQATAFLTALEEYLALPFGATVLGEAVVVEKIDLSASGGWILPRLPPTSAGP
jgi:Calcium binding